METRHLYWILTGPSFAAFDKVESKRRYIQCTYIQTPVQNYKKNCFINTDNAFNFCHLFVDIIMSQEKQGFLDRNTKVSSVYRVYRLLCVCNKIKF
jgi:hypothetical protein